MRSYLVVVPFIDTAASKRWDPYCGDEPEAEVVLLDAPSEESAKIGAEAVALGIVRAAFGEQRSGLTFDAAREWLRGIGFCMTEPQVIPLDTLFVRTCTAHTGSERPSLWRELRDRSVPITAVEVPELRTALENSQSRRGQP